MPGPDRGMTSAPLPARPATSKSAPQSAFTPGQSAIVVQELPSFDPPTHTSEHGAPAQVSGPTHAAPSFGPPAHSPRRLASRRIVYGASADPNRRTVPAVASGSLCGSKMGGSSPPSGVYDARNACDGMSSGGSPGRTGGRIVVTRSRGTGETDAGTIPRQLNGTRRLPAPSTAIRRFVAVASHGGILAKQACS